MIVSNGVARSRNGRVLLLSSRRVRPAAGSIPSAENRFRARAASRHPLLPPAHTPTSCVQHRTNARVREY